MPIPIICPCAAKLRVSDHLRGLQIQCPRCGAIHDVGEPARANGRAADRPVAAPSDPDQVLADGGLSAAEGQRLQAELNDSEQLLWAGKPQAGYAFLIGWGLGAGLFMMALFLLLVVILTSVQGAGLGWLMTLLLIGLALALVGAGVAVPFWNRRRYQRTAYAVTSERALVWDCDLLGKQRFTAYEPADMAQLTRRQLGQRAPFAHLIFASESTQVGRYKIVRHHGFLYLREADVVERLLRERLIDPYTDRLYQ